MTKNSKSMNSIISSVSEDEIIFNPIIFWAFFSYKRREQSINNRKSLYFFIQIFPMLKRTIKHFCHFELSKEKRVLNVATAFSGVVKNSPVSLVFTYSNKQQSFDAKLGLYVGWLIKLMFWESKNVVVSADVWELALSCRVIRLRRSF